MSHPRIVVPGATTALTRRTTLRKAFLAPWHPLVSQCWLYALAHAQLHTGMAIHHSVLVVNHHHTTVTPGRNNLPEFIRRVHRDLSCALHCLLAAQRYDTPRELFDDRQTHCLRLLDDAAQASHLLYEHLNPVAAGLVDLPEHMPQTTLDFGLWKTGFLEVKKPPFYFSRNRPESLRLYLTPPPLLYQSFHGDLESLVYYLERMSKLGGQDLRRAHTRKPLGAKALRRIHPWSEPKTLRERGGERVPSYRIGARGLVARKADRRARVEVSGFRTSNRAAFEARRAGHVQAIFPYGTYAMDVYHGAPTDLEPPPGALVSAPGPTLEEVRLELDTSSPPRGRPPPLTEEVKAAFREEARELIEHETLEMVVAVRSPATSRVRARDKHGGSAAEPTGEPIVVRHHFDPPGPRPPDTPRVVTLRDRRRGRPPTGGGKHGSDPPV